MLGDSVFTADSDESRGSQNERARRRALGIYYTPPEAARLLAEWTIQSKGDRILEPSFGGCAMLAAAVSVLKDLGCQDPSGQLYGFDVDAAAFGHLADLGLDNSTGNFRKQDFLLSKAGDLQVDAVLANPPFVSYHRLTENQRQIAEDLRQRYLPTLPRLASLWAFFLLHSMTFLRMGGRMAFVLPNAVGTADYARPLLAFLGTKFEHIELVQVSERLFIQAGTDERISLLLLSGYIPKGMLQSQPIRYKDVVRIDELETNGAQGVSSSPPEFGTVREKAIAALAPFVGPTLRQIDVVASVQIGEVIGDIDFFVRPMKAWRKLGIGPNHLVPLLTRSAQVKGLFVRQRGEDGDHFVPYLLLPPERRQPQAITGYISQYDEKTIATNRTFEKRTPWYRCSYETTANAFIGSMSHDYPRIIGNNEQVSCSNAFYKIKIVGDNFEVADWLPMLSLTTPLRLSAEILGRVRGSGGIKLEPSDVRRLLIPTALPSLPPEQFNALRNKLNQLVQLGEIDAAEQLANSEIYIKPMLISAQMMSKLRAFRISLTSYRLIKPSRLR